MNITELENLLKKENKLRVIDGGEEKNYVKGSEVYYDGVFHNKRNVFGITKEDEEYFFFMTDCECGIPIFYCPYESEAEACDEL